MKNKILLFSILMLCVTGVAAFLAGKYSTKESHTAACPPYPHTHAHKKKTDAAGTSITRDGTSIKLQKPPPSHGITETEKRYYMAQTHDPQRTEMIKTRLSKNYATFIRRANLSSEDAGQLIKLMAEKPSSYSRLIAEEHAKGKANMATENAREKALQANAQYKFKLEQLLGNEKFEQYEKYTRTLPGRVQVESVMLGRGSPSFTDAQMDIFAEVFTNIMRMIPNPANSAAIRKTRYDMFLKNIQSYVSPNEMNTLSEIFKTQNIKQLNNSLSTSK